MRRTYEFVYPHTLIESGLMVQDTEYEMRVAYDFVPAQIGGRVHSLDRFSLPSEEPTVDIESVEIYGHPLTGGAPEYRPISPDSPLWNLAADWVLENRFHDLIASERTRQAA